MSVAPVVVGLGAGLSAAQLQPLHAAARSAGRVLQLLRYADPEEFAQVLPQLEVLYGRIGPGQVAAAPRLRWVHSPSAGVEGYPLGELAARGIVLTNARGLYAEAMAEHAFALLLALTRGIVGAVRQQQAHRWQRYTPTVLAGRRLGILGLGAIGSAIAQRARAMEMEVWATRRRPAPHPAAAHVLGPSRAELLTLLRQVDAVVAVLPSTPETRGLLDREALAAMRPGSYLVNVGRGELVVEGALDEALRSGHLAGAGLDCPPRDPLPPDASLWEAPGILITPHVGGVRPDNPERGIALFARNLARYLAGQPLENVVDLQAGY